MVSPDPPSFRVVALLRLNIPTVSEVVRAAIIEQFLQTVIELWWLNGRSDVEALVHIIIYSIQARNGHVPPTNYFAPVQWIKKGRDNLSHPHMINQ